LNAGRPQRPILGDAASDLDLVTDAGPGLNLSQPVYPHRAPGNRPLVLTNRLDGARKGEGVLEPLA
jgi:hypothetical protein